MNRSTSGLHMSPFLTDRSQAPVYHRAWLNEDGPPPPIRTFNFSEDSWSQQSRLERQRLEAVPHIRVVPPAARASNAPSIPRQERERLIRELREENENPAPAMSRACRVCTVDSPHQRAVFTACGHAACRACALKLAGEAADEGRRLACPVCRAETDFVPLFENPLSEEN